jgi:hypothetical protein
MRQLAPILSFFERLHYHADSARRLVYGKSRARYAIRAFGRLRECSKSRPGVSRGAKCERSYRKPGELGAVDDELDF